jgi:hypothetical protein
MLNGTELVMNEWVALAESFSEAAKGSIGSKNMLALSRICRFLADSQHGQELVQAYEWPTRLELKRRDGSHPTKFLRVMGVTENRIEFCLRDDATGVERYFQPHEPHDHALERFQEVVGSIDWNRPVTGPGFGAKLKAWGRFLFVKRYGTWQARVDG